MESTKRIDNHKATVHNAEHFLPEQIERMQESATRQEKIIARIFYNNKRAKYGPGQLHKKMGFGWPITSTRRAFTNLTNKKEIKEDGVVVETYPPVLEMTDETRPTEHGRSEHKWRWKRPSDFEEEPQQGDMFGKPKSKGPYAEVNR